MNCKESLDGEHCWHADRVDPNPAGSNSIVTTRCCWCKKEVINEIVIDTDHGPFKNSGNGHMPRSFQSEINSPEESLE